MKKKSFSSLNNAFNLNLKYSSYSHYSIKLLKKNNTVSARKQFVCFCRLNSILQQIRFKSRLKPFIIHRIVIIPGYVYSGNDIIWILWCHHSLNIIFYKVFRINLQKFPKCSKFKHPNDDFDEWVNSFQYN